MNANEHTYLIFIFIVFPKKRFIVENKNMYLLFIKPRVSTIVLENKL